MEFLHVHGQDWPHDEVVVEGSPDYLLKLAKACVSAVESRGVAIDHFFANDGEGYALAVVCAATEEQELAAGTPYTNESFLKDNGKERAMRRAFLIE
jgi:hypothetical protein